MLHSPAPWEHRFHRTVVVGHWVGLFVGAISSLVATNGSGSSLAAMVIAAGYTTLISWAPQRWWHLRFGDDALALGGTLIAGVCLTLTGGPSSPYLLFSIGPPVLATVYGGLRAGIYTGSLAGLLMIAVTLAQGGQPIDAAPAVGLYLVFVLLVGAIRRLLDDIHSQASALALETRTATQKLERLEAIHSSLVRLSEDVSSGRLNAIEIGADVLESILETIPGSAGRLAVDGDGGRVVLAARGIPPDDGIDYEFPLATADSQVGQLTLTTPTSLSEEEQGHVAQRIHPATVAFANLRLLQEIVESAVAEERTRLAREMHDEIGPALASLGLALDMAAMQQADRPEVAADLQVLRSNVTKLVEDVRAAVADLRNAPGATLTARILQGASTLDGSPPVVVDIEERRPPRSTHIGELTSIVNEAVRNAHRHSASSKIVVSGQVDRDFGTCSVVDDGIGFDPSSPPEGHFGIIGMQERAAKIGAAIKIDSKSGVGTAVTVEWGSK